MHFLQHFRYAKKKTKNKKKEKLYNFPVLELFLLLVLSSLSIV